MSDVVEAMARAFAENSPCEMTKAQAISATRAAIRALHERGGLVVGKMPGEAIDWRFHNMWLSGHNAALAAVRANAVKVEGV